MIDSERKPVRLDGYDYSENGAYFVTICTKNRAEVLCVGANLSLRESYIARPPSAHESMPLSDVGEIVKNAIARITTAYPMVVVNKYVIMPNHIHMIIFIETIVGNDGRAMRAPKLSTVINQMKGYATKQIGYPIWQRSFHDHIIRNESDYRRIWRYIDENPAKWHEDIYYSE